MCVILVDYANNKIYWHKKLNGAKKRCLKSQDKTLEEPKSLAIVTNESTSPPSEIVFICTKSGLVASSKNYTIKHEVLMPVDICYDSSDGSVYFISSYKVYEGCLLDEENRQKLAIEDLNIKYKLLFSCSSMENRRELRRIVTSKDFIYIMCGPEELPNAHLASSSSSKAIIYAYTKFKS